MGMERRGSGTYYYRKRRRGGRVVSEYVGAGALAELSAALDAEESAERARKRAHARKERGEIEHADRAINELGEFAQTIARAVLLVSGCHTHKGQWRKCKSKKRRKLL